MTVKEIRRELAPHKKVTLRQVQNYIRICGIRPLGIRQCPQNYPEDSAEIILRRLGYAGKQVAA